MFWGSVLGCKGQGESKRSFSSTQGQARDKTDGVRRETRNKRKNAQITEAEGAWGFGLECMAALIRGRTVLCHQPLDLLTWEGGKLFNAGTP